MRLSARIAIAVGVAVPVLVLASGWVLVRLVGKDLQQEQDDRLRGRAAATVPVARKLLRAAAADRPAAEQAKERRLFAAALDVGVRLTTAGGDAKVVVQGGPQPPDSVPLPPAPPGTAPASLPASVAVPVAVSAPVTVSAGGESWRALSARITGLRPETSGTLWLFSPASADRAEVRAVQRRVALVALLAAPLSALLVLAVAERATLPLRRLQKRASGLDPRVSAARLDHRPSGVAEVDALASTLQTVLGRYDEQAARTAEALGTARSFSTAASHELRTPLMSMRTNLDILAAHPDLQPADRAEVVEDLRREHERLQELLVMLRALARGDLVETDAFGIVDLAEVVEAAVAEARRRSPGALLTVRSAAGLRLHGWEPGLRMVVDNLLSNALTHGVPHGEPPWVNVELRPGGDPPGSVAVLTVDDVGPGIPPAEREAVFQRFRRRQGSPGSGLGLTLVAQQIALHRGRVRVLEPPSGRGTRFEVRLALDAEGAGPATLPERRDWLSGTTRRLDGDPDIDADSGI